VASSPELSDADWTVPEPLKRGAIYLWQVRAVMDGADRVLLTDRRPDARFRIIKQVELERLERVEAADNQSHLALGALYLQAGLLNEAEREFDSLARLNPGSILVDRLARGVKSLRQE
jgi:hypothetical protein